MKPGEYILSPDDVEANKGRQTVKITVCNTGDRPIQVGSHFHFFEANKALEFDRATSFGKRLNIPAGTAIRFEPGDEKAVALVDIGGKKVVFGLNNLTNGSLRSQTQLDASLDKAGKNSFKGVIDNDT